MKHFIPHLFRWLTLGLVLTALAWAVPPAAAQKSDAPAPDAPKTADDKDSAPKPPKPSEPWRGASVELDVPTFLKHAEVVAGQVTDAIWNIAPQAGKKLYSIPLYIKAGKEDTVLDQTNIKLRAARLVAFRLNEPHEKVAKEYKNSEMAKEIDKAVGQGAPMFARKITITSTDKVKWDMERNITGGTVLDSERPYALKLKSEFLSKRAPAAPRPNDAADSAAYRVKAEAYRNLTKEVRALPDEFEMDIPLRIWATFELNPTTKELFLELPNDTPFQIPYQTIEGLRTASKAGPYDIQTLNGKPKFERGHNEAIAAMYVAMTCPNQHHYHSRMVSFTMVFTGLIKWAEPGDSLYQTIELVLKHGDVNSRTAVIKDLTAVLPPTKASRSLLASALQNMAGSEKGSLFKEMAKGFDMKNLGQTQEFITQANQLIADPKGPPVEDTLKSLFGTSQEKSDVRATLLTSIRFDNLPDARMQEVTYTVVENASTSPLAASFLDLKLLGATDNKTVKRTLEVIANADTSDQAARAVANAAVTSLFGKSASASTNPTGNVRRINLGGTIPITNSSHSMFRLLRSGDPAINSLAWRALSRFSLGANPPPAAPTPGSTPGPAPAPGGAATPAPETVSEAADPYAAMLDIATSVQPTPIEIVDFYTRQRDSGRVLDALVRIILSGSEEASRLATRAMVKPRSGWPVDEAIQRLSYGDRQGFANRVYDNMSKRTSPPLATILLKQAVDNSPLVTWFGKELAAGRLPDIQAFAARAGGEDVLLPLVAGSDPDMALGAAAALVNAAGGDDRLARDVAGRLRGLSDQSPASLKAEWTKSRKEIFTLRMQRAAGGYRLVLALYKPTAQAPGATPGGAPATPVLPATPTSEINLGVVQLQADAQGIKLANGSLALSVPDTVLSIRVEKPSELKAFNNDQITPLGLEKNDKPVDLLPQPDGSWRGKFGLADGRIAELSLRPAGNN